MPKTSLTLKLVVLFCGFGFTCGPLADGPLADVGQAQTPDSRTVATISAIERVVERRQGTGAQWKSVRAGDVLRAGDAFRTGKRSKADVRFADSSLIRLGQLPSLEVRGEKQVRLNGGSLLFSYLKPGLILAGTAAAEIKGSVGIITVDADGSAEFTLYRGIGFTFLWIYEKTGFDLYLEYAQFARFEHHGPATDRINARCLPALREWCEFGRVAQPLFRHRYNGALGVSVGAHDAPLRALTRFHNSQQA